LSCSVFMILVVCCGFLVWSRFFCRFRPDGGLFGRREFSAVITDSACCARVPGCRAANAADFFHSAKQIDNRSRGAMLRRRRLTNPDAASFPATQNLLFLIRLRGTRLSEFFQMNNPASKISPAASPCKRYLRINAATPEVSTMPKCRSSKTTFRFAPTSHASKSACRSLVMASLLTK